MTSHFVCKQKVRSAKLLGTTAGNYASKGEIMVKVIQNLQQHYTCSCKSATVKVADWSKRGFKEIHEVESLAGQKLGLFPTGSWVVNINEFEQEGQLFVEIYVCQNAGHQWDCGRVFIPGNFPPMSPH